MKLIFVFSLIDKPRNICLLWEGHRRCSVDRIIFTGQDYLQPGSVDIRDKPFRGHTSVTGVPRRSTTKVRNFYSWLTSLLQSARGTGKQF